MLIYTDNFLIKVSDTQERPLIKMANGQPLIVDTDYNPKEHRKQIGEIVALPMNISSQHLYDNPLEIGDTVLFSHLALEDFQHYQDNIYRAEYHLFYAKIKNGIIEPLEDILICEAMNVKQDSVIAKLDIKSEKYCKVIAVSNKNKKEGVIEGDIIHFTHNANYSFKVGEKEFVRLRTRNIIAIERNGDFIPMRNKVMVKEIEDKKYIAGIEIVRKKDNQKKGVVIKTSNDVAEVKENDIVCYFLGTSSRLNVQGTEYAFVNKDNIKFIYR